MKAFLTRLSWALRELLTSKKFLVAASATAGAIAAGQDAKTAIMLGGAAYVTGQGMADFGKNAK